MVILPGPGPKLSLTHAHGKGKPMAFRRSPPFFCSHDPKLHIGKPLKDSKNLQQHYEARPNWTSVGYFAQN